MWRHLMDTYLTQCSGGYLWNYNRGYVGGPRVNSCESSRQAGVLRLVGELSVGEDEVVELHNVGETREEDKDRSLHVLVERVHWDHTQQLLQVRGHTLLGLCTFIIYYFCVIFLILSIFIKHLHMYLFNINFMFFVYYIYITFSLFLCRLRPLV